MERGKQIIAIFPGRFDPPHLGHIITIMRILPNYEKVIVAITDDNYGGKKKRFMSARKREYILWQVFKNIHKVDIVYAGKGFRIRKQFDDLPPFDVVLSGNKAVIRNMHKHKIPTQYIERTRGYSGTKIRKESMGSNTSLPR